MHEKEINSDTMEIKIYPIGRFHTGMTPQTGAPRQGILQPENTGVIEIYSEFVPALEGLEKYEYIIVLYHMNLSTGWKSMVRPPGSKRAYGLFATRTPNRPNPVGFAVIKLERIEGSKLYVSGIDAYDGTPVIDIKPWIPTIDCPGISSSGEIERALGITP